MFQSIYSSPLGNVLIKATPKGIRSVQFTEQEINANIASPPLPPILQNCHQQLEEYFAHQRKTFDLAFDWEGTDFQKSVWEQLLHIPFGKTITYGYLAQQLNKPNASRAVGSACGKNKIWLIVPCHRVIGSTGKLTGYAGGVPRKKWLLEHESGQLTLL